MSELAEALLMRTALWVEVASVSRSESDFADLLETELQAIPGLVTVRVGDNVIAYSQNNGKSRVLLGGHLDTVPAAGNDRALRVGSKVSGVGAADMKGGLAVMFELAMRAGGRDCDTVYVFYAREEVARAESGLLEVDAALPELMKCDVALLLEPTGAVVEAGCQGSLRVEIVLRGVRAHSARPWTGQNAIHRIGKVIDRVAEFPEYRPVIDGCEFRESMQVVGVSGGGVGNVIPDEATALINYRFAPDKSIDQAVTHFADHFRDLIEEARGDVITVVDAAAAAPPNLDNPVLERLVVCTRSAPRAKLAWTDVAFFSERGIPAANFGPGDPLVAHRADEFVLGEELTAVFEVLDGLLDQLR